MEPLTAIVNFGAKPTMMMLKGCPADGMCIPGVQK